MTSHTRLPWGAVLLVLAACPGSPPGSTGSPPGSSESPPQLPTVHSTPITADETWHARDNPHVVHGVLTVGGTSATFASGASASATLTLEPGVEVRFDEDSQLTVDQGALKAPGTAEQPIRLVANQSVPTPGFWRGLLFTESAGESLLENVLFSDCGREVKERPGSCLYVANRTLVARDLLVRNSALNGVALGVDGEFGAGSARLSASGCKGYPVRLYANHADALPTGGTFTDNGVNVIALFDGVRHSQTWPNLGIPYDILGSQMDIVGTASAPATLTLSAGTVLRFDSWMALVVGPGGSFGGPGDLIVNGTEEAPVRFTSASSLPQPGDWGGVTLGQISAATHISHALIEYAGSSFSSPGGNLNLSGGASCTDCPTLDHVTLQKGSTYGLVVQGGWLGSGSTGVTIRDNAGYAIFASADSVEGLQTGVSLALNGNLHDSVGVAGSVVHSQTWNNLGIPYDILGNLTVGGFSSTPTALTLSAGTVLRFGSQATLDVGISPYDTSTLIVNGTEEAPVRFTSSASSPQPGDWGGVNLGGSIVSATRISHAIIEYAGNSFGHGNLNLNTGSSLPTLDHVLLRKSSAYGLVLDSGRLSADSTAVEVRDNGSDAVHARANSIGGLPADMIVGGNSPDAVDVYDGDVTETQTWPGLAIPYILAENQNLTVTSFSSSKSTLTLAAGAEVRFPQRSALVVQSGALRVAGTAQAPVRLVPNTSTPFKGFWQGVQLHSTGNRIDHAFISHGGAGGSSLQGNLNVYQEDGGFVTNSTFSNGGVCGIMVIAPYYGTGVTTDFTLPMYNNTFLDNATAAQCSN